MSDFTHLDATAQAELVRSGKASPLELVDDAINNIEKLNPELNAVIHPLFDSPRRATQGTLPDGPFRGVPTLFKDLFCAVEGDPIHEGMQFLKNEGWRADHTDALAQGYLDAGFVCVGRTNTPELGLVPTAEPAAYGPSRNPWDTTRTTGGSSGGSAAAVASGMVAVAHANDGGGSIRIPASCCGLVGLKPSRGRTSLGPDYTAIDDMLVVELCVSRSGPRHPGVLDTLAGPSHGETVTAPRRRDRSPRRSAPIPASCGSRCSRTTRSRPARSTPTVSRRRATPQRCSNRSATPWRRPIPSRSRVPSSSGTSRRSGPPRSSTTCTTGSGRSAGRPAKTRWSRSPGRWPSWGGRCRRPTTSTRSTRWASWRVTSRRRSPRATTCCSPRRSARRP